MLFTSPVLLLLLTAAIVLLVIWRRTEDNRYAYGLAGVGVLLLLFFGYQKVRKETPAEQIRRKLFEMAAAVQAKNVDGIFQHVSADFRGLVGTKESLRKRAQAVLDSGELTGVEIWNEQPAEVKLSQNGQKGTATIEFLMKPKGPEIPTEIIFRTIAHFVQDADGEWRIRNFELFRVPGNEPFVPR